MKGLKIIGTAKALPKKYITNDELSKTVDTNDEWITTRTGIKQRYFCDETESNYVLATRAANEAIKEANISLDQIDFIIVATFTPDYATPSVSCLVQRELGLREDILAFDVNAACSGFIYGLEIAASFLSAGKKCGLVIGSEQISSRLDMNDRGTCILFGDGCGAAVVTPDENEWISIVGARGNSEFLGCKGSAFDNRYIYMNGKEVFKFAVKTIPMIIDSLLEKSGLTIEDVDCVICHQANERIIKNVSSKYKGFEDRFYMNIQKYGNTSAASIPMALDEARKEGLAGKGKRVMLAGFGAGFTWGGVILNM